MNRETRMAGVRLGLTYAAAIMLFGLLVAMLNKPGGADVQPESGRPGAAGRPVQAIGRAEFNPADAARFGFTPAPDRNGPAPHVPAAPTADKYNAAPAADKYNAAPAADPK